MYKHRDPAWLREQYLEKRRSLRDIGHECGISHGTVHRWLKRFGIATRTLKESMKSSKRRMSIEKAKKILAEPIGGFISADEFERKRQESWGKYRKEQRKILAKRLSQENLEREVIDIWHDGDVKEQMDDIQEQADYIE